MTRFDTLAFIGRFQPFHNGHKAVVDQALEQADRVALVIGSDDQPRDTRNPFTTQERIEMISAVYPEAVAEGRIMFVPQVDHTYNLDRWIAGVQTGVKAVAARGPWTDTMPKIGLIGHAKDHSSFYLKSFPTWGSVGVGNVSGIDATSLRDVLFGNSLDKRMDVVMGHYPGGPLPEAVVTWVRRWKKENKETLNTLCGEMSFIREYKEQFSEMPFPPTFNTVDSVVVQSGHVLLVKRGTHPGKGLWALPGGFLEQGETLLDGALRELREETKIAVPAPVIRGSLSKSQTFDDPYRSLRGRTITQAFYFRLQDREELPKIKGSDDAVKAAWVPLSDLRRNMMFEDHYDIIETLVGV